MAANPKSLDVAEKKAEIVEQYHVYHAEAKVLSGELEHPIKQPLENYGRVVLEKTRREGHFSEFVQQTSVDGLISFRSGHTHVSGSHLKNKKDLWCNDHSGWVTLSTSVSEGLNILEVITADRVVSQVSTEHPQVDGHIPKVTFLGTRFENLRVAGYPVQLELDLGFFGNRPAGDQSYLYDSGFLDKVATQLGTIIGADGLPKPLETQYTAELAHIDDLKKGTNGNANSTRPGNSKVQCSLVKSIEPIPGAKIFGNLIFIPDFGTVSVAEVEVGVDTSYDTFSKPSSSGSGNGKSSISNYFTLHMLNMKLGCIGAANVQVATASSNGQTKP